MTDRCANHPIYAAMGLDVLAHILGLRRFAMSAIAFPIDGVLGAVGARA